MNIRRQTGLSLVELMVALVVGLLLLGGVIEIFVANKQTYRVAEASARIQENARFAAEILGRYLRIAGYRADPTVDFATAFAPVTYAGYSLSGGQIIAGGEHEVVIRYQGDGTMKDCAGGNIPLGNSVVTRFYLDSSDLKCSTDSGTQPLVSNIQQMTIRYGVDTNDDGIVNCYDSATHLNSGSPTACGSATADPWDQVIGVRITLTLESAEDNTSVTTGKLQRTYTTTFALRNRLP